MKIGVSVYSFNKLITGGYSVFDAIEFIGKTGFDCVELTDLTVPDGETLEGYIAKIKDCAKNSGVEISGYITYADFINGKDGDGDIKKETERVKRNVDIAEMLGAKMMRHDSTWGFKGCPAKTYKDAIEVIAPPIREVTEYAAAKGIKTMCENHGYFMQDSYRMEALVKAVNHPNFGLLVDMGNFMCADEDPAAAVVAAAPYAFHAHAKDFLFKPFLENPGEGWFPTRAGNNLRGTIIGHGAVPVKQCLSILKKAGYDGIIAIEFEGLEEPLTAIKLGYNYLRNALA